MRRSFDVQSAIRNQFTPSNYDYFGKVALMFRESKESLREKVTRESLRVIKPVPRATSFLFFLFFDPTVQFHVARLIR